jgi:hypothetical protein
LFCFVLCCLVFPPSLRLQGTSAPCWVVGGLQQIMWLEGEGEAFVFRLLLNWHSHLNCPQISCKQAQSSMAFAAKFGKMRFHANKPHPQWHFADGWNASN